MACSANSQQHKPSAACLTEKAAASAGARVQSCRAPCTASSGLQRPTSVYILTEGAPVTGALPALRTAVATVSATVQTLRAPNSGPSLQAARLGTTYKPTQGILKPSSQSENRPTRRHTEGHGPPQPASGVVCNCQPTASPSAPWSTTPWLTEGHVVQAVPGAVHHCQPLGCNELLVLHRNAALPIGAEDDAREGGAQAYF